ncbi:TenA family transcriptional regulator [Thiothrix nivea]|uniref:TENA/THI-4 domain-containing protein n=1 Tax=Thiothrix nivea (strain ATCC 35100 / DSM 5205 / JP2) TaxID=870187 RepID=A0A656HC75_THINJ|nr:iron-containing redox enzyme family protein [Thiothrix nivea]EIJ33943.1 TENA/THI-4 domain-containing protein [Thiothrix nivea DSM 5205]
MNAKVYMQELKERVNNHPFLHHPFLQRISTQQVTFEQARTFALLYYPHILRTRLYQANALGVTPDEGIQAVLADILYDEYGNGDPSKSHMEVYRKLLRALDFSEEEMANAPITPEQQGYIDTMMRLTQGTDWLAAVGVAGIAGEWPIPPYYRMLLTGLRTVPGLSEDALELFVGHIDLDIHHSQIVEDAILPYLDSREGQASLWRGIELNLNARLVQLNGLQREVFGAA